MKKKRPHPGPLSGAGWRIWLGAQRFRGPVGPVTNTSQFKVLELMKGERTFKLAIPAMWKIHPIFQVSLLEPYRASVREGREQPPRVPENIEGDFE